jgi:hypothetical protein
MDRGSYQEQMNQVSRTSQLYLALVTALLAAVCIWLVLPAAPPGLNWDDTWYIWMAEWYSGRIEFQGVALSMLQARQYPPLFSWLLSMTGDSVVSITSGLVMNALFISTGIGIAMLRMVREGQPLVFATIAGAIVLLNPVAFQFLPTLMSEPLFLLLSTAVLVIMLSGKDGRGILLSAGVLAGLAVATRSAGWALILALLISMFLQNRRSELLFVVAGVVLAFLFSAWLKAGLPQALSYLDGYRENASKIDVAYLLGQVKGLIAGWVFLWGSSVGGLLAAMLVVPGMFLRLLRHRIDTWYLIVSIGMLVAWPYPDHMGRFLWILMPAFLLSAGTTAGYIFKGKYKTAVGGVSMAVILVFSVPDGAGRVIQRIIDPPAPELNYLSRSAAWTTEADRTDAMMSLRVRHQLLEDMKHIEEISPVDQCIHSELSAMVSITARRVSYASRWNSLDNVRPDSLLCRFYYVIPTALPGVSNEDFERFAGQHQELFRSYAPYDDSGETVLGGFFRLLPEEIEGIENDE